MAAIVAVCVPVVWGLARGVAWAWPSGIPSGDGGAPATDATFACPEPCELFTIAWTGDTMVGSAASKRIKKEGYGYVLKHVPSLIEADFSIANAEAPFTRRRQRHNPDRKWEYNSRPRVVGELAAVGFDAFGLANNHVFDRGPEGIADSQRYTRQAKVTLFGAGMNDEEAEAPLIVETPFGKVGVVAIQKRHYAAPEAGDEQPGTPWLRKSTIERLHRRATDAGARWVVAYVHWGRNYEDVVLHQKWNAARFAAAGYDLVVGHGSHIQQAVGQIDGMPVLYSLGNFVFNTPGRYTKMGQPGYGLVARTFVGPDGFEGIELTCVQADNQVTRYQLRPCNESERAESMRKLGPLVEVRGDVGVVTLGGADR